MPNPTQPRHIAIVMDGNGRWASLRGLERHAGHRAGIDSVRLCIEECARRQIEALTLFAFSSENWQRPDAEVDALMNLFVEALDHELPELQQNGVRLRFIGERQRHSAMLQSRIAGAEHATSGNAGLKLQIAPELWRTLGYRRRSAQAGCALCAGRPASGADQRHGVCSSPHLQLAGLPDPDLLIRTGGEQRLSNFLLWNLAYAELYFCATPCGRSLIAPHSMPRWSPFAGRQRRFGLTGQQVDASA